jgi:hypothetical protein
MLKWIRGFIDDILFEKRYLDKYMKDKYGISTSRNFVGIKFGVFGINFAGSLGGQQEKEHPNSDDLSRSFPHHLYKQNKKR